MTNDYSILYERSGGFMGQTIHCEVNSDTLPKDLHDNLNYWLQNAPQDGLIQAEELDLHPDQFKYVLRIKGNMEQEFTFSESNLPKNLVPILNFLNRYTRTNK